MINEAKYDLTKWELNLSKKPAKLKQYKTLVLNLLSKTLSGVIQNENLNNTDYYNDFSLEALSAARFAAYNYMKLVDVIENTKKGETHVKATVK